MSEAALARYARLERALGDRDAPLALVDLSAWAANADDLVRRAGGKPIRVASKSVRCRHLLADVLRRPGFHGVLAFTLAEALWLAAEGFDDIVVAYPTADRSALRRLSALDAGRRIAIMVDSDAQLDLVDEVLGADHRPVRVCIDVDAGLRMAGGRLRFGAKRSPLRGPEEVAALARRVLERRGFDVVGLMAYESQIAGVGDRPPGRRLYGMGIRAMQRLSRRELVTRRAEIVEAVRAVTDLEFVNAGGTGSVESSTAEAAVTEVAAGSGLYGPALFDAYSVFTPRAAAMFALPVVRKPGRGVATALGGGYVASGAAGRDRLPQPVLPPGLSLDPLEGAGEVQTPLLGAAARELKVGDRVYFRHAKAGELCERFASLHLVDGEQVIAEVPTYRGEGQTFL